MKTEPFPAPDQQSGARTGGVIRSPGRGRPTAAYSLVQRLTTSRPTHRQKPLSSIGMLPAGAGAVVVLLAAVVVVVEVAVVVVVVEAGSLP